MILILSILHALIFSSLALLHLYWMIGGRWGSLAVIPTDRTGRKLFQPPVVATFMVAVVLLLFALINLAFVGYAPFNIQQSSLRYALLGIAFIFLLRAIGDFRYIGFSKRYRRTRFARMDNRIYSPLCFILAVTHCLTALYGWLPHPVG